MPSWRDICRPIIAQVLANTKGLTEVEVRKALKEAYPFGERKYHPYKVWLSEIKLQTKKARWRQKKTTVDKNQQTLF